VKELVTEANLECSPSGIQMQAMDASHVSLVCLLLRAEGFKQYNCSRNVNLGLNLSNMAKILKCANKDDSITLRYEGTDSITFLVESTGQEKVSEFCMKLMEIEGDSLGIPDQTYKAVVSMPSSEFTKLCRDMQVFGESVSISVSREAVKFTAKGELGSGSTTVKPTIAADVRAGVKREGDASQVDSKREVLEEDPAATSNKSVIIDIKEDVTLNFALKNLVQFTKAAALSERVKLSLAKDVPLSVEYKIGNFGYMRFYLAPKVDDEEAAAGP